MAINFQAVPRKNPTKPGDPPKFYASPVYQGKLNLRKIAKEISERTSLSTVDTMAVLEALTQVLPFFLLEGNIVNLGDFGTFRINLHSTGVDKEEDLTSSNVTGYKLNFRPGKEYSLQLNQLETAKA